MGPIDQAEYEQILFVCTSVCTSRGIHETPIISEKTFVS